MLNNNNGSNTISGSNIRSGSTNENNNINMNYFEFKQSNSGMINDYERENKSEKLLKLKSDGKTSQWVRGSAHARAKKETCSTIAN